MKKLIVIIAFIVKCHILLSQEEKLVVFFTDAITSGVPDVEILGQSKNRYEVRIIAINENNIAPIVGWVDKVRCGVWLRGKNINSGLWSVSLYRSPSKLNPFMEIMDKYIDGFGTYTNDKAVPVLNYKLYKGKYWIKTEIIKDNNRIIGWTRDYCPNVYGSCN